MTARSSGLTMSVEEAADALGIGRGLAYRLARARELPVLRIGRRLRVPVRELSAWIDQNASVQQTGGWRRRRS